MSQTSNPARRQLEEMINDHYGKKESPPINISGHDTQHSFCKTISPSPTVAFRPLPSTGSHPPTAKLFHQSAFYRSVVKLSFGEICHFLFHLWLDKKWPSDIDALPRLLAFGFIHQPLDRPLGSVLPGDRRPKSFFKQAPVLTSSRLVAYASQ